MRVLIISDTHRRDEVFPQVLQQAGPVDMVLHAGDAEGSEYYYRDLSGVLPSEFRYVAGNNDFFTRAPQEELFYIGPHRTLLTHGHRYGVSLGDARLRDEARARGAAIVVYGHTHKPVAEYEDGILVLNPGSLAYPRQSDRRPSYLLLDVAEDGALSFAIQKL